MRKRRKIELNPELLIYDRLKPGGTVNETQVFIYCTSARIKINK